MNRLQYLLCKLAEEASEVAHVALKAQQFGLEHQEPHRSATNKERLYSELKDLITVVNLLNEENKRFDFLPPHDEKNTEKYINKKIERIEIYYEKSKELGMVK